MTLKATPLDPAQDIEDDSEDDAAIAEFINDSLDEDNAAHMAHALGIVARARGMSQLARDTGLSRESLYKALSQDGNPELDTLLRVMKALRLKLSIVPANEEIPF